MNISILALEIMVGVWGTTVLGTYWFLDSDPLNLPWKRVIALWCACFVVCALVWQCLG